MALGRGSGDVSPSSEVKDKLSSSKRSGAILMGAAGGGGDSESGVGCVYFVTRCALVVT